MVEVNAAGSSGVYSSQPSSIPNKNMEMSSDMFLQLLVTQMRYQDPFSGGQDVGDFMSQVAQFTLLERVVKLQQTLEDYAASQAPIQALNLLNKVVEITGENGEMVKGEVSAVRFQEGLPLLKVNEKEYPLKALNWVKGTTDTGE